MGHMKAAKTPRGSVKRVLIDKANTRLVVTVSIAVFAVIFSLVAAKTLWTQSSYQKRVIDAKNKAATQLQANVEAMEKLSASYSAFVGTSTNIIGGNSLGTGPQDGNNAKIILDALPSKYDFPALATNLETLMNDQQVTVVNISGVDDEIAQSGNTDSPSPTPVEMPFQLTATADYVKTQALIGAFERSIRPIKITTLDISGAQDRLTVTVSAMTYYQPAKSLNIREEIVP